MNYHSALMGSTALGLIYLAPSLAIAQGGGTSPAATQEIAASRPGPSHEVAALALLSTTVKGFIDANGTAWPEFIEGRVLVRFSAGISASQRQAILGDDLTLGLELSRGLNLHQVLFDRGWHVSEVIDEIGGRAGILYACPDHVVTQRDTFPNDPLFNTQFGKHNTGQGGGTPDADMDAPGAWDLGTGTSEFAVAIVDGGMQRNHPDLQPNLFVNVAEQNGQPGVDDDGNGFVDDVAGWNAYGNNPNVPLDDHGTHVAGIAAARGNNGIGVAGVSWNARIVPVAGSSGSTSTVILAYSYALALKDQWIATGGAQGANIVASNSSFGIDFADCNSPQFAPWNDMYNLMGQSGILSVCATVNSINNVDNTGDVPTACSSDFVISVTATNNRDRRTFSGFGPTTIDLGAPGDGIMSTVLGGNYGLNSGTSMATPQVTGAVAHLNSVASAGFDRLRATSAAQAALEIKAILLDTVDVVPTLDGRTVSGGRMNLEAAAQRISRFGSVVTNYCGPAPVNSTGASGEMSVEGRLSVGANNLRLAAASLPAGAATLFLVSRTQGFTTNPAGSQGNLCLGGNIGRLVRQIGVTNASGRLEITLDLQAVPQPTGPVSGAIGDTWNFQAWHRDAVGGQAVSNFTDGVSVVLE